MHIAAKPPAPASAISHPFQPKRIHSSSVFSMAHLATPPALQFGRDTLVTLSPPKEDNAASFLFPWFLPLKIGYALLGTAGKLAWQTTGHARAAAKAMGTVGLSPEMGRAANGLIDASFAPPEAAAVGMIAAARTGIDFIDSLTGSSHNQQSNDQPPSTSSADFALMKACQQLGIEHPIPLGYTPGDTLTDIQAKLEALAGFNAIRKKIYNSLVKRQHPDYRQGDKAAEARFKDTAAANETIEKALKAQRKELQLRHAKLTGQAPFSEN